MCVQCVFIHRRLRRRKKKKEKREAIIPSYVHASILCVPRPHVLELMQTNRRKTLPIKMRCSSSKHQPIVMMLCVCECCDASNAYFS